MESKPQSVHINLNELQKIATPTVIKTSKQWVLPPRPRPGRKPNATTGATKKEPKKTYKKKNQQPQALASASSSSSSPLAQGLQAITPMPSSASTPRSPPSHAKQQDTTALRMALKSMKEENKTLKLELSRLVADLKSLKQQQQQQEQTCCKKHVQEEELFHKKRSPTPMDDEVSSIFNIESCEEDDNSSQISTPSLVSTVSSMSSSSLHSIKEDQVLKIDDFLTASLFERSSNSISNEVLDMSPPSLPLLREKIKEEEYEFNFLKQENNGVFKNDASDLLFQCNNDEMLVDDQFWEWK